MQFNGYLSTRRLNSTSAYYKASKKHKSSAYSQIQYTKQTKQKILQEKKTIKSTREGTINPGKIYQLM